MIPRYQRILFWSLAAAILLMMTFLIHGCQQAHKRLTALSDATPIAAPTTEQLALPQEPTLRARALLEDLLAGYALPASTHPLQSGPAVDDVFLLNLPIANPPSTPDSQTTGQLAVINLHGGFIDNHPSGIQVETLTIQSIIGTLHATFPQITEIRFLVDGQPHDTLAGHADLLRTYPATDTTAHPAPPTETPDTTQP